MTKQNTDLEAEKKKVEENLKQTTDDLNTANDTVKARDAAIVTLNGKAWTLTPKHRLK